MNYFLLMNQSTYFNQLLKRRNCSFFVCSNTDVGTEGWEKGGLGGGEAYPFLSKDKHDS